jgi:hypothetical protein
MGNWTGEQTNALLAVPDRSTLKGKRDYVIPALLVGCALRRRELAILSVEDIQRRENRWVIADMEGKGTGSGPSPSLPGGDSGSRPGRRRRHRQGSAATTGWGFNRSEAPETQMGDCRCTRLGRHIGFGCRPSGAS